MCVLRRRGWEIDFTFCVGVRADHVVLSKPGSLDGAEMCATPRHRHTMTKPGQICTLHSRDAQQVCADAATTSAGKTDGEYAGLHPRATSDPVASNINGIATNNHTYCCNSCIQTRTEIPGSAAITSYSPQIMIDPNHSNVYRPGRSGVDATGSRTTNYYKTTTTTIKRA